MCGIASFLSNRQWTKPVDTAWLAPLEAAFSAALDGDIMEAAAPLDELAGHFYDLMAFGLHMSWWPTPRRSRASPPSGTRCASCATRPRSSWNRARAPTPWRRCAKSWTTTSGRSSARSWKMWTAPWPSCSPDWPAMSRAGTATSWPGGPEQVLESIDKLEVRRPGLRRHRPWPSSCPRNRDPELGLSPDQKTQLSDRCSIANADTRQVLVRKLDDGRTACRFLYKVAQLVGQLGDNGAALRAFIAGDELLWSMAEGLETLNIIAHTAGRPTASSPCPTATRWTGWWRATCPPAWKRPCSS